MVEFPTSHTVPIQQAPALGVVGKEEKVNGTCHNHGFPLQIDMMIIINSVSENVLYCARNFGRSEILDKEGGQLGPLFYAVENAQLHRHDQRECLCGGVDLPTPSSKEALCEQ